MVRSVATEKIPSDKVNKLYEHTSSVSQNEVSSQYFALLLSYERTILSSRSAATLISFHQQPTKRYELLLNPVATNISSSIAHLIISSKQEQSFYLKTNVTNEWFFTLRHGKKRKVNLG